MNRDMARGDALTAMDLRPVVSGMANTQPAFPRYRLGVRDAGRAAFGPHGLFTDSPRGSGSGMTINLVRNSIAVGLLLLSGCEAARNMRDDFSRLASSQPAAQRSQPAKSVASTTRPRTASTASTSPDVPDAAPATVSNNPPARPATTGGPLTLAGKSETELRAMLGAPTSEEDRPPGKRWRYRDGQCTLDVQLYPDVQTKQFGTLAYEVKSDDNTDEGKRVCLAQLQSRAQARH
jgi:glucose/arabinose dehydrogenase